MPLDRHDRAELEAFKGDVVHEVNEIKKAAVADCEAVIAPFRPLAKDVAALKLETEKQTPIIEKLEKESRRAARERKKRAILDEDKAKDAAQWRKRYRAGLAVLGAIAAIAEIYRAVKGHG